MAFPNLTPLPTPPNPDAPATFDTLAYPFTQAQVTLAAQINALVMQLNSTFFPDMAVLAMIPGTAALPVYSRNGDPNTGMFFPAADTIALSTNGVERLRLSAAGLLTSSTAITQSPTDTTVGRLTKTGDGGQNGSTSTWTTHCDDVPFGVRVQSGQITEQDAIDRGWPTVPGATTTAARWFVLTCIGTTDRVSQEATEIFGTGFGTGRKGRTWRRIKHGTWSPWRIVYDTTSIVAPVAVGGDGIPTGGVLEEGSGTFGRYIKYASGAMKCWGKVNITPSAAGTPTSVAITFPATFIAAPDTVLATALTSVPQGCSVGASSAPTAAGTTIYLTRTDTTATNVSWEATGRWQA